MSLLQEVTNYVALNISTFHDSRLSKLKSLNLENLLKRKNPYLYKAKDLNTPQEIVESIASAFLSSAEETMFGDWLEQLAIFIASYSFGGYKSTSEGIDLEMDKDGIHYIVSIKSGPKWSNSSSLAKLKDNFLKAKRIYRTSGNRLPCEAIEGCCYGKENNPDKTSHLKLCGEAFWEFISGSETLYIDLIQPLGTDAKQKNEAYMKEYKKMITRFTKTFANDYCNQDGEIEWDKIVSLNSGK
ncbi:MAG: cytosolic protein [Duncaniella sp.]|nr:cytosolic protein [Duncaniella sp.]